MTTAKIPAYINEDLILEALDRQAVEKHEIKTLKLERILLGGNYCSDIYRAKVEYVLENNKNKIQNANLLIKELFSSVTPTSQEHFSYARLLPLMEEILTKAGIESPALSPKLYLARKAETELHVFQDMCALGYKVCDRYEGFNLPESKMIMEKLANFHAASMIVMQKQPELAAKLRDHFWVNNPAFKPFRELIIDENIKHIVPIVAKWPGYEDIADKLLKNIGEEFERRFLATFDKSTAKMQVIAHGDLWIKNILVKHGSDAKSVDDAVFIDYQNCFIGSPALDIHNIIMTSLHFNVLTQQREYLIQYYFEKLCKALQKYNAIEQCVELPTFEDLQYEMQRLDYFTFYALIFAFPQTNLSEELAQDMDYDGFFEPKRLERNRLDMFSNTRVLETLKHVLKRLDNAGLLDQYD